MYEHRIEGVRSVGNGFFLSPESKGQQIHDAMIPKQTHYPLSGRARMDGNVVDNGGEISSFLIIKIREEKKKRN